MISGSLKTVVGQEYQDPKRGQVRSYWPLALLVCIIIIGGYLRFYRLGTDSIWLDEYYSIRLAAQPNVAAVLAAWPTFTLNAPLYFLLLHFWLQPRNSEFYLRLPSALFGILSIIALYLTATKISGWKVGLLSALLIALSPMHLWHSQDARMYTLLVFFTLLSSYFLWIAWQKNQTIAWVGYVATVTASLYTHYLSVFFLAAQSIFVGVSLLYNQTKHHRILGWFTAQIAVLLLFAPCFFVLWRQAQAQALNRDKPFWIAELLGPPSVYRLAATPVHFSFGYDIGDLSPLWAAIACFGVLAFVFIRGSLGRQNKFPFLSLPRTEAVYFSLTSMIAPVIALWLVSQVDPLFISRYTVASSSFFYILLARGLCSFRSHRAQAIVALVVISIFGYYAIQYEAHARTAPRREMADYVAREWQADDIVLLTDHTHGWLFSYYAPTKIPEERIQWPEKQHDLQPDEIGTWLDDTTSGRDRIWFVRPSSPSPLERDPISIQAYLDTRFSVGQKDHIEGQDGGSEIILYTRTQLLK